MIHQELDYFIHTRCSYRGNYLVENRPLVLRVRFREFRAVKVVRRSNGAAGLVTRRREGYKLHLPRIARSSLYCGIPLGFKQKTLFQT